MVVLDTSILVYILQGNERGRDFTTRYNLDDPQHDILISIVTVAELRTLAFTRQWGEKKLSRLDELLSTYHIINISDERIIESYINMKAYSRNQHPTIKRKGAAVKTSDNDLWIASSAHVISADVITNDNDFDIFNPEFITVLK